MAVSPPGGGYIPQAAKILLDHHQHILSLNKHTMKKLVLPALYVLLLITASCKKKDDTPTPDYPSQSQPTNNPGFPSNNHGNPHGLPVHE
jgi:hypothetical protein